MMTFSFGKNRCFVPVGVSHERGQRPVWPGTDLRRCSPGVPGCRELECSEMVFVGVCQDLSLWQGGSPREYTPSKLFIQEARRVKLLCGISHAGSWRIDILPVP